MRPSKLISSLSRIVASATITQLLSDDILSSQDPFEDLDENMEDDE